MKSGGSSEISMIGMGFVDLDICWHGCVYTSQLQMVTHDGFGGAFHCAGLDYKRPPLMAAMH